MGNKAKRLVLDEEQIEMLRSLLMRAMLRANEERYENYLLSAIRQLPAANDVKYLKYGEAEIQFSRVANRAACEILNDRIKVIQNVTLPELERRQAEPERRKDWGPDIKKTKKEVAFLEKLCYSINRSLT